MINSTLKLNQSLQITNELKCPLPVIFRIKYSCECVLWQQDEIRHPTEYSEWKHRDIGNLRTIESKEKVQVDVYKLKQIIIQSVKDLFGEAGAANQIDILKYIEEEGRIILRCFANFYIKLRASLTFCSGFNDIFCSFHVTKASPCLLSLQANSQTYKF